MAAVFRRRTNCAVPRVGSVQRCASAGNPLQHSLILWGENPSLQLGDLKTLGRTGYDGNNLRFMNTLSGGFDWMLRMVSMKKI